MNIKNLNEITRCVAGVMGWKIEVTDVKDDVIKFRVSYELFVTGWLIDDLTRVLKGKEAEVQKIVRSLSASSTKTGSLGVTSSHTGALYIWTTAEAKAVKSKTVHDLIMELQNNELVTELRPLHF